MFNLCYNSYLWNKENLQDEMSGCDSLYLNNDG